MRIVIIGAGNAGRQLARRLCDEKHSVVMVDADPRRLAEAESGLDILSICGEGTHPSVLQEARVDRADLVIAVTDSDEVNILSCLLAHAGGAKAKIARVTDPAFVTDSERYDYSALVLI